MVIKILGSGCARCKKTAANAEKAVNEIGIEAEIKKIEDMDEMISYNVMKFPALLVDDQVKFAGKVPTVNEIKQILA